MKKILVTGAMGQIGSELIEALIKKYGAENIIGIDIKGSEKFDLRDTKRLEDLIKDKQIGTVYHLVSLLSGSGEQNPNLAWEVNVGTLKSVLDLAMKYDMAVFWPSSIAAFGPTTPKEMTPQRTILEPTTMYGVTKVAGELLCQYYFGKYRVDVRSVRYPGLLSYKVLPSGGTTDYATEIFYEGIQNGNYKCFLNKDSRLPMMYMDDAIRATLQLMTAPNDRITVRTSYNLAGVSFTPEELVQELEKFMTIKVEYSPDVRQKIADSWPKTIDDSQARQDWGWEHEWDLAKITEMMYQKIKEKI